MSSYLLILLRFTYRLKSEYMKISSIISFFQLVNPLESFVNAMRVQEGHVTIFVTEDPVTTVPASRVYITFVTNNVRHSCLSMNFWKTLRWAPL